MSKSFRILIIEDEAPAARRLQKLVEEIRPGTQVLAHIDSVEDAAAWLQSHHPAPDLIFMDIQLSDGLSFEIFNRVEVQSPVIFTTAYNEYALKAFKVNSIDYLLKPIDEEELRNAIEKFDRLAADKQAPPPGLQIEALLQSLNYKPQSFKSRFLIKIGEKYYTVPTEEIAYFYTEDKSIFLRTFQMQRYPLDYSLDDLEKMLDPSLFYRLNRQYLAHVNSILRLHSYFNGKMKVYLKPESEHEVIVSRDKASLLKAWLDR